MLRIDFYLTALACHLSLARLYEVITATAALWQVLDASLGATSVLAI